VSKLACGALKHLLERIEATCPGLPSRITILVPPVSVTDERIIESSSTIFIIDEDRLDRSARRPRGQKPALNRAKISER
jgi:hypothetical protein